MRCKSTPPETREINSGSVQPSTGITRPQKPQAPSSEGEEGAAAPASGAPGLCPATVALVSAPLPTRGGGSQGAQTCPYWDISSVRVSCVASAGRLPTKSFRSVEAAGTGRRQGAGRAEGGGTTERRGAAARGRWVACARGRR